MLGLHVIQSLDTSQELRPMSIVLEYFEISTTIATLESTVEVPTQLKSVIGVISLGYIAATTDPTDSIALNTDGVITTGAVTVITKAVDVADGAITIRGFLVGKQYPTD